MSEVILSASQILFNSGTDGSSGISICSSNLGFIAIKTLLIFILLIMIVKFVEKIKNPKKDKETKTVTKNDKN